MGIAFSSFCYCLQTSFLHEASQPITSRSHRWWVDTSVTYAPIRRFSNTLFLAYKVLLKNRAPSSFGLVKLILDQDLNLSVFRFTDMSGSNRSTMLVVAARFSSIVLPLLIVYMTKIVIMLLPIQRCQISERRQNHHNKTS